MSNIKTYSAFWSGILGLLVALAPACSDSGRGEDPQDGGIDAGFDAGHDAGADKPAPGDDGGTGSDGCAPGRTLVVVWESPNDLGDTIGIDYDIQQARSPDDGASWCGFGPLNSSAYDDEHQDEFPKLASDGRGGHLAVWQSLDTLGGTVDTDADIFFSRSTDGGATWTEVGLINHNATTDDAVDRLPNVATDGQGTWLVAWESNLELDGGGDDYDIFFSRSDDDGLSWSDVAQLNGNAAGDGGDDHQVTIRPDGAGTWLAIWDSPDDFDGAGTDPDILVARSTDDGVTWSDPELLNSSAKDDRWPDTYPQLATDGQGNWVAVWTSRHTFEDAGDDGDVAFARSTDNGLTWSEAALLNSNADSDVRNDGASDVVTDGAGTWLAVWTGQVEEAGTGRDSDIFYARSTDDGATWSDLAPLNPNAATDSGGDTWAKLVAEGPGTFVAVWSSKEEIGDVEDDMDIFMSRSTDAGLTWSEIVVVNPSADADLWDDEHPSLGW